MQSSSSIAGYKYIHLQSRILETEFSSPLVKVNQKTVLWQLAYFIALLSKMPFRLLQHTSQYSEWPW